jgi:hypothetical protein
MSIILEVINMNVKRILSIGLLLTTAVILARVAWASGLSFLQPPPPIEMGAPETWIVWPEEGQEYTLDELSEQENRIKVIAQAFDPNDVRIEGFQLFINGQLKGDFSPVGDTGETGFLVSSQTFWTVDPVEPGDYLVEVRATNQGGASSEPAIARISIVARDVEMTLSADKSTVKYGECTTLRWSVVNAQEGSAKLNDESVPFEGERKVCPQQPSNTYRLTALSLAGEPAEQEVTLTVPATPEPPPGVEITFEADKSGYQKFGDCLTLEWTVKNAQAVQLDGTAVGLTGSQEVCPEEPSNVYRLTVESLAGETVERTIIVNVPATPTPTVPPQAPSINFTADQYTLNQGSCTTLRWTVSNAHTIRLDGAEIASQGSQRVCPTASVNNYTVTATGSGGSVQKTVTINVSAPQPQPLPQPQPQPQPSRPAQYSITASPNPADECTTLSWYIEGVQAAYLDGGQFDDHGVTGPTGQTQACDSGPVTYVLYVILPGGGSDSRSVTVSFYGSGSDDVDHDYYDD